MPRTDPEYFDQFLAEFVEGPGRAYIFLTSHNRWWHYDDGYWSWNNAGYDLNQAIPDFAKYFLEERGLKHKDPRIMCFGTLSYTKTALRRHLAADAIPGRPSDPPTVPQPPPSAPPAQPVPAEPAPTLESGPLGPPVTAEQAG